MVYFVFLVIFQFWCYLGFGVFINAHDSQSLNPILTIILMQGLSTPLETELENYWRVTELENYWRVERGEIDTMVQTEVSSSNFFVCINILTHDMTFIFPNNRKLSSLPLGEIFTSHSLMILVFSVTA